MRWIMFPNASTARSAFHLMKGYSNADIRSGLGGSIPFQPRLLNNLPSNHSLGLGEWRFELDGIF